MYAYYYSLEILRRHGIIVCGVNMAFALSKNIDILKKMEKELYAGLGACMLCPRRCGADRTAGPGSCGADDSLRVALYSPFMFEEPPISGTRGAGNVFFSNCNLRCVYCQNYEISQEGKGVPVTAEELADMFIELEGRGCHNINLVSPTPYLPFIVTALIQAFERGFELPVVYNTNGYELPATLGIIALFADIFLPDVKYASRDIAARLSGAPDYPEHAFGAVMKMVEAAGHLETDEKGIAVSGVIVRHLVLPGFTDESKRVLRELRRYAGRYVYLGLMSQYTPVYKALRMPPLDRTLTAAEYEDVSEEMSRCGFINGWVQETDSADPGYIPEFFSDKMQLFGK